MSRFCFALNDTEFFEKRAARAARTFFPHSTNQILSCGVVIAVDVVDAKSSLIKLKYPSFLPGFRFRDLFDWSGIYLPHSRPILCNHFFGNRKFFLVMHRFFRNKPIRKTFVIKGPSENKSKSQRPC